MKRVYYSPPSLYTSQIWIKKFWVGNIHLHGSKFKGTSEYSKTFSFTDSQILCSLPSPPHLYSTPTPDIVHYYGFLYIVKFSVYISKKIYVFLPCLFFFFFFLRFGSILFHWGHRVGHDWATELNWTEHTIETILHIDFFPPFNASWRLCHCVCVWSVAQLCPTPWDSMGYSPPGSSSVHGTFQIGILEWVAISYSRGSFQPRDWTHISCIGRWILYHWPTWEAIVSYQYIKSFIISQLQYIPLCLFPLL